MAGPDSQPRRALGVARSRPAIAAVACVLGLGLVAFSGAGRPDPPQRGDGASRPAAPATTAAETPRIRLPSGHTPASGPAIGWIEIPRIDLEAPVIRLGLNPDASLEVPSFAGEAGLWSGGAIPGERGAAVIAGHVDSVEGAGVFARLGELEPGDEIRYSDGPAAPARFAVIRSEEHPKDAFPTRRAYAPTSRPTLRLITCTGGFDEARARYPSNLIVFAHGIEAERGKGSGLEPRQAALEPVG